MARASRNGIRANRFARIIHNWNPYFYSASGRFARITRISDSRKSPDSRESCESIRANHTTKFFYKFKKSPGNHMDRRGRKFLKNALQPVLARRFRFPSICSSMILFVASSGAYHKTLSSKNSSKNRTLGATRKNEGGFFTYGWSFFVYH